MIKVIRLRTPGQQARGLIGMKPIPTDTVWFFPLMSGATGKFHTFGVLEPIEIMFLDGEYQIIRFAALSPDQEVAIPDAAVFAVESAPGVLQHFSSATLKALLN